MDTVKKLGKAGQMGMNTMIKDHGPERPSDEQAQYHGGKVGYAVHKLTDALSWLVQEAGGGKNNPVPWLGSLPQYALKPFRGEGSRAGTRSLGPGPRSCSAGSACPSGTRRT